VAEARRFRAIKGVRDILPPETALWNHLEQIAREVLETYNFREIRLPVFEETGLFARSVGADTDIVSKEMYTFQSQLDLEQLVKAYAQRGTSPYSKHFGREGLEARLWEVLPRFEWLTLRPEATASVVRAYIEHGMDTLPGDVKLYYVGPMFRRERPQKGRYRQFYQIGAEVLGRSDAPAIDAEVIEMLLVFFELVGLAQTTLYLNSIGCKNCRPAYVAKLREALQKVKEKLGPDSLRRIESNPLRVLDSKLPEEQAIIGKLPKISDHLCADCRAHFAKVKEELKLRGIAYKENWRLVRGLDYYTRTTFEVTAPGLGAQDAICGGGRYDGLVELLGVPEGVKGIGFAIGTDRAILSLQQSGKTAQRALDVFVAWIGQEAYAPATRLARRLRATGLSVELPPEAMKLKRSLGLADKLGTRYALLVGENEIASGRFVLRRMADGEQQELGENELVEFLTRAEKQQQGEGER
jgi:histidyl-tRNA synthetase